MPSSSSASASSSGLAPTATARQARSRRLARRLQQVGCAHVAARAHERGAGAPQLRQQLGCVGRERQHERRAGFRGERHAAASSTTCAFVPPTPSALTEARSGAPVRLERHELASDPERSVVEPEARVRLLVVDLRRDCPVLERQHRRDQPGEAGAGVEMPDVGLHRAEEAASARAVLGAERRRERLHLDRVAFRRAGPVRLHIADRLGADSRPRQRQRHDGPLPLDARGGERPLPRAVVVDGGPAHDRAHAVAVRMRGGERLQQHRRDAVAADGAVRLCVEGAADPRRRHDRPPPRQVAVGVGDVDRAGGDDRRPAIPVAQRAARHVQCHERRRARRLDAHCGSGQPEPVGDSRGREVRLVADQRLQGRNRVVCVYRVLEPREQMGVERREVHAAAGEDADRLVRAGRLASRQCQQLVDDLEQHPLLRGRQHRLARRHAERLGCERVDVLEAPADRHEGGVVEQRARHPGLPQALEREALDRAAAAAQQPPILVGRARPRKAQGRADDRHPLHRRSIAMLRQRSKRRISRRREIRRGEVARARAR